MKSLCRTTLLSLRPWRALPLAGALALTAAGIVASVIPAQAAPAALPAGCTAASGLVTCKYTTKGETQFAVPAGVTSLTATVVGGQGGKDFGLGTAGGLGAVGTGTLTVTGGQTLFLEVGILGGAAGTVSDGLALAGAGGGESDVRTCAAAATTCAAGSTLASRLLVAGGGGGSGDFGGAPGNAGTTGVAGNGAGGVGGNSNGAGGGGATQTAPGAGGAGCGSGSAGGPGAAAGGAGGNPGPTNGPADGGVPGGGGGAGWFGGGAGGSCSANNDSAGSGGGGTSHAASSVGNPQFSQAAGAQAPSVTLTYHVLTITTTSLQDGRVGIQYAQVATATGGTTPYSWSVGTGLPPGLSINSAIGLISGIPQAPGTYTFTVTVTDSGNPAMTASQQLTINVIAQLVITTASLQAGQVGTAYRQPVAATGGTTPYSWTASGLPPGLSIDSATGIISGTPTASGTFLFTVTVADSENPAVSADTPLAITVEPAPLAVTTTSLPAATGGAGYTATLAATGGTTPYSWSVTAGSLPPGLTLNSSTGVISGIPTVAGTYSFTATVTDSESPAMTASAALSISVSGPVITSLNPNHGPAFGRTEVLISGTGLSCPAGVRGCQVTVTFGGRPAAVAIVSPGLIGVDAPPGQGTVDVVVTVGGVSSHVTAADKYTYGGFGLDGAQP